MGLLDVTTLWVGKCPMTPLQYWSSEHLNCKVFCAFLLVLTEMNPHITSIESHFHFHEGQKTPKSFHNQELLHLSFTDKSHRATLLRDSERSMTFINAWVLMSRAEENLFQLVKPRRLSVNPASQIETQMCYIWHSLQSFECTRGEKVHSVVTICACHW